ncbi:MAG TPA: hypothetical protein VFD91_06710 [Mariniphaga sp.]|nr:hypothetical protein [Mariniphaga sp.]
MNNLLKMEKWKLLTIPFDSEKHHVLQLQHLAVQYIALTGRYLIPPGNDETNIAMQYLPEQELLIGKQHPDGWLVSLQLRKLILQIRDDNMTVKSEIDLEGQSFPEALIEFKKELHSVTGADVSLIRTEQPYELPEISDDEGLFFNKGSQDAVFANIKYRNNANLVLNEVRAGYTETSPLLVWPNHFDTGFSFPVEHSQEGKTTKTIGVGWAIPDKVIDEPYYYISLHSDGEVEKQPDPEDLPYGEWMMPEWNGAVLRHSDIIAETDSEKQKLKVKRFLETGVKLMVEHFKISH